MIRRCTQHNGKNNKYYFNKGITVCKEWLGSFLNFFHDMGVKPPGLTLDRINNDLGYYKENCQWLSRKGQNRKMPTKKLNAGIAKLIREDIDTPQKELAKKYGVTAQAISAIRHGKIWNDDEE